jgi:hypothetical protein
VKVESEQPALSRTEALAHVSAQAFVIAEARKLRRGGSSIARREETPVCADSLTVSTASSRDDWNTVSHGLGDCQAEGVCWRRCEKDRAVSQQGIGVIDVAEELDASGDSELGARPANARLETSGAGD